MPGLCNPKVPSLVVRQRMLSRPRTLKINNSVADQWSATLNHSVYIFADSNFTLARPKNLYPGANGMITIKQDGTGSRVISWATGYRGPNGSTPVLTTSASATDEIAWYSPDGYHVDLSMVGGFN
jgi:hypothetical protein